MYSRPKILESKIGGSLYPYACRFPRNNGFEYHHRRVHTARTNAYVMATPCGYETQIGADRGIRRWLLVSAQPPENDGAKALYSVIILSVLRLVSILDQGSTLQSDITCEYSFIAANMSRRDRVRERQLTDT